MIRSTFRLRCTAILVGLALPAAASAQDKDESFRRGLDARGDKKWQDVVTHMRSAIQSDPQESTRRIRGGLLSRAGRLLGMAQTEYEYLPYYFLGEALLFLNDCAGAVEAWSVSEQQRAVVSRDEFVKSIQDGYRVCASKGVLSPREFNPLLASTRQRITDVTALSQRISDAGKAKPDLWTPQLNDQFLRARNELLTSNSRLDSGSKTRSEADFKEANAAADRAAALLKALEGSFNAAIDNVTALQRQSTVIEEQIAAAEAADRAIDALKSALPPALAATRANGRTLLTRSRTTLDEAVRARNSAAASEAAKYAQDASGLFNQVLDQIKALARGALEQRLLEAIAQATEAFSFVDASFATLDRLAAERPSVVPPELAGERDKVQKQFEALRRRFDRARRAEDVPGIQETLRLTTEARGQLDALIKSFGPVTLRDRGVHAALEAGARAFFDGEYQAALTALDPASTPSEVPLQLHVHLFRAAALYGLYVRSGEKDQSLLTRAMAEVERCKQLNPGFTPDSRAFGPRFIGFFQLGPAQRVAAAGGAVANP